MMRTLICLICCALFPLGVLSAQEAIEIPATVYQTVNVRSGAGTHHEIIQRVDAGTALSVNGRDEGSLWIHVTLADDVAGWVPLYVLIMDTDLDDLPVISTAPPNENPSLNVSAIAFGRVNVRSGPGITYDIVAQLDVYQDAQALARSSENNDWLYIQSGDITGWVAYFTMQVNGNPNILPIRVPDIEGDTLIHPTLYVNANFNTQLHTQPDVNAEIITVIPFEDQVIPLAQSVDSTWLYVTYQDGEGWALAELFNITPAQLDTLPEYSENTDYHIAPEQILTVVPTAESNPTSTPQNTPEQSQTNTPTPPPTP